MIIKLTGRELADRPRLRETMHLDRSRQFKSRLGWPVRLTADGLEIDEYDLPHTLYVIAVDSLGDHCGSMRFLPTTSNTMIHDHFSDLVEGVDFCSPTVWECTRFCISEERGRGDTVLRLLHAGAEIMNSFSLDGFVAVFDSSMRRIYRRYGVEPEVLGSGRDTEGNTVNVGIWHNDNLFRDSLEARLCDLGAATECAIHQTSVRRGRAACAV